MGSSMKQITQLFILEAFVTNLIAFGLCCITSNTNLVKKYLINVTGLPISKHSWNIQVLALLLGLIVIGTFIIGLYPFASFSKSINIVNILGWYIEEKLGGVRMSKRIGVSSIHDHIHTHLQVP